MKRLCMCELNQGRGRMPDRRLHPDRRREEEGGAGRSCALVGIQSDGACAVPTWSESGWWWGCRGQDWNHGHAA